MFERVNVANCTDRKILSSRYTHFTALTSKSLYQVIVIGAVFACMYDD